MTRLFFFQKPNIKFHQFGLYIWKNFTEKQEEKRVDR